MGYDPYERSLALNVGSENGKEILRRLVAVFGV
jgi:hypothetical protein